MPYTGDENVTKALEEIAEKYKNVEIEAVILKINGEWVCIPELQDNEQATVIGSYTGDGKKTSRFIPANCPLIGPFYIVTTRKKD